MLRIYCFSMICLVLISCSGSKDVAMAQEAPLKSDLVEGFLPEKLHLSLLLTTDISLYEVQEHLIEGTENEYSNKLVFIRDLTEEESDDFLKSLKSDSSYRWKDYSEEISFNPTRQFVCKNQNDQFSILTNADNSVISFISLEGQNIISVQNNFRSFLNNLN